MPSPSCSTCPYMRFEGNSMRCYFNPPAGQVIGTAPSKIQGAPPVLIIVGVSPEVHPDRFCSHHPDLADGKLPPLAMEPIALPANGSEVH